MPKVPGMCRLRTPQVSPKFPLCQEGTPGIFYIWRASWLRMVLVSYALSRWCLTNRFHKWLLVSYALSCWCFTNRFHKWLLVSYALSRWCFTNRFHKWLLVSYALSRWCLTLPTNKLGGHPQFFRSIPPRRSRAFSG